MPDKERFDYVVIGAGPAGSGAAMRLSAGAPGRVALIERENPGGTCLNWGCVPTKALASAARKLAVARKAGESGIVTGTVSVDVPRLFARVGEVVSSLREDMRSSLRRSGVEYVRGEARVLDDGVIAVTDPAGATRLLEGGQVLLATGSVAAGLPGLSLDGETVLDSRAFLAHGRVPARLAVVGGGAIGCEFAYICATLGSSVTIVEIAPQLLPGTDKDVASQLAASFGKQGIAVKLGASVAAVEKSGGGVRLVLQGGDAVDADRVLLAVGRSSNLAFADTAALGIELAKGRVVVDERLQTTRKGWYAAGDLVPGPMLAYTADEEGAIAADNMAGKRRTVVKKAIPLAVYCWPECAQVGAIEGPDLVSARHFFKGNARACCEGEAGGLVKVFAEKKSGIIRGFAMLGPYVSELIGEATVLVEQEVTLDRLSEILHVHPALSEILPEAARKLRERL